MVEKGDETNSVFPASTYVPTYVAWIGWEEIPGVYKRQSPTRMPVSGVQKSQGRL